MTIISKQFGFDFLLKKLSPIHDDTGDDSVFLGTFVSVFDIS